MTLTLTPQTDRVVLRRDISSGVRYFDGDRMIYGETGWVDADAYFPWLTREGVTSPYIRMRRIGGETEIEIRARTREWSFTALPPGWRPATSFNHQGDLIASGNVYAPVMNSNDANSLIPPPTMTPEPGTMVRGVLRFTASGWPASAPAP